MLVDDGVLMCRWVLQSGCAAADSGEDWEVVCQEVIPVNCQQHVLQLAHKHLWLGNLRIAKTNQPVPTAPLQPVPAVGEPFEHVLVDCVGPLSKTKSANQFLLSMMCVSTRFPEAVPLHRITATAVTKALVKFFATCGLSRTVQTDQGSIFLSSPVRYCLQS